ncbi:hypothetical protein [Flavobacterium aquicola]|uniref:Uncharacterized protein n=1 Tax=Flavobacterium aquicola TaxID=1682742 RepID=A0A3E0E5H9_9FLAO|nr:hypothetical protein [Flavobacterium aquicola]REG93003.1 hypothetical protein C8P67_114104 [Flavobacterium aquicola]
MIKNKNGYNGLADLRDGVTGKQIDLKDFSSGAYMNTLKERKNELSDSKEKPLINNNPAPKTDTLPGEYVGKSWDDLYQSDKLETIRTNYPIHYENLRKEKFKTNY